MTTTGGQIPIFWQKMTPNISVLLVTPQFEPFGWTKQPQIYIQDKAWWYIFKINSITGGNPIHGDPGGQNPTFWPKMTTNIGNIQKTSLFGPFDSTKKPQIYI